MRLTWCPAVVEIERIRAGRARDVIIGVLWLVGLLVCAGAVFTDLLPAEDYLPLLEGWSDANRCA